MTEAETQPNGSQTHYLRYGDRLVLVTDNGVHAEFGLIRRVDVERNVEYPLVKGWCSLGGSQDLLPPRTHYTVTIKTES